MNTMIDKERASLYETFRSLQEKDRDEMAFNVANISDSFNHKLGCSFKGMPMFFVECSDREKITDIKLDILSVMFNRECQITQVEEQSSEFNTYSIIQLNSDNTELIKYFLDVIYLILRKLPSKPCVSDLRAELIKVIKLFSNPTPFSKEIVRGLWAELLVIEQSSNPDYLVASWHTAPEDKFDFNDGANKIEVKSTTNTSRSHVFALEQLYPNANSRLLIASIFVIQSGMGKSVFDIANNIQIRLSDPLNSLKLNDIILQTIGANISQVEKMFFDYNMGVQSKEFYLSEVIPAIPVTSIPTEVTKVHFTSDLSACTPYDLSDNDCLLFKSAIP